MIPRYAFLKVVDNSGGKLAKVIGLYGQSGSFVGIGDVVKVAIKEAKGTKVTPGTLKKAVITETKYPTKRKNGAQFQFLRNTCVLLSEKGTPIGNRVKSLLTYEFIKPRWKRMTMLSPRLF